MLATALYNFISKPDALEKLEELNLGVNFIGCNGAKLLAAALQTNTSLKSLQLAHNFIGPDATGIVLRALLNGCCGIKSLDLTDNDLDATNGAIIGDLLRKNAALTELVLNENGLGDEGVQKIAAGLAENTILQRLSLTYNNISTQGIELVRIMIFRRTKFAVYQKKNFSDWRSFLFLGT
jgi:Ran GTPase-activating protein (RanGAP) involved in mRNA processing and transport